MRITITSIYTICLLFASGTPVYCQLEDLMGAVQQVAEMENEQNAQSNSDQNQNQGSAGLTQEQEERNERWREEWENREFEYSELLYAMDNKKFLKCYAMMILYVDQYLQLVDETDRTSECTVKYDLYGMQLLAMATSTTVMYCPESMSELQFTEFRPIFDDFYSALQGMDDSVLAIKIKAKLVDIISRWRQESRTDPDDIGNEYVLDYLIKFFRPEYILSRTLEIGREMEALGCGG